MNKTLTFSILSLAALGLAVGGTVYAKGQSNHLGDTSNKVAHGGGQGYETVLTNKADILGVSVEELKEMTSNGKTFSDIAQEQGISKDELHETMKENMQNRVNQLVSEGIITQDQADQRLERMQENLANCADRGNLKSRQHGGSRGMGMGIHANQ